MHIHALKHVQTLHFCTSKDGRVQMGLLGYWLSRFLCVPTVRIIMHRYIAISFIACLFDIAKVYKSVKFISIDMPLS